MIVASDLVNRIVSALPRPYRRKEAISARECLCACPQFDSNHQLTHVSVNTAGSTAELVEMAAQTSEERQKRCQKRKSVGPTAYLRVH